MKENMNKETSSAKSLCHQVSTGCGYTRVSEPEEGLLFVATYLHYTMIIVEPQAIPPVYKAPKLNPFPPSHAYDTHMYQK